MKFEAMAFVALSLTRPGCFDPVGDAKQAANDARKDEEVANEHAGRSGEHADRAVAAAGRAQKAADLAQEAERHVAQMSAPMAAPTQCRVRLSPQRQRDGAAIRSAPSFYGSDGVGLLPDGATVIVEGPEERDANLGIWRKVRVGETVGWVNAGILVCGTPP